MDNNALFVFECLLRDNTFMSSIDEYIINTIFITKTFDAKNVPQMVLILMTLLTKGETYINIEKHLKNDTELHDLLTIFYTYIIDRIKENPNLIGFNTTEFKKSYDICARLAVLKLKFTNKSALCCIRGQAH
jgi:hypothetical protein